MKAPFELSGYDILEKIGEGGMSSVWKARQLSLDRLVAIKAMSASYLPDQEALSRFRQEAQAAARLNHPGIVQIYDAGEADGMPYLVMEFVDGCTVADLLERKGRLTEKNALLVAEAVAAALGYAWDKDCIIHCDVKPDNVLVEPDGTVKVTDLGLARFIGLHRRHAAQDTILGTPNYTSPEQSQGVPDLDCRTDIYSLGAMLYHMATGVLPFAGSPGSSAMDRHVSDFLPDPCEQNAELSGASAWLIEKMMVKDRAYRTPYWSSVLLDVRAVKDGKLPLPPLPEPGQSTVARSASRPAAGATTTERAARVVRVAATSEPRRRIVVAKGDLEAAASERVARRSGVGRALFNLLVLLAIAGAVYASFRMGLWERVRLRLDRASVVAPAEPAVPAPAAEDEAAASVDWGDAAAPESGMRDGVVVWDNPDFKRGAALYNEALALYEGFQKTRANQPDLARAERLAREAIERFEACQALAPPDVDVATFIKDAYHLISDTRHSTLLSSAGNRPREAAEAPEFAPAPAVPPASWETPARAAPASPPPRPLDGLALSPVWNKVPLGQRSLWEDLRALLESHGTPDVNLSADPSIPLYGGITYLMPVREAARLLGVSLPGKRPLDCPGFPDHSMFTYSVRGTYEGGFDQLLLLTDLADHVVAVELVNENPRNVTLEAADFSERWRAYNFAQGKSKLSKDLRVAHRVRPSEKAVAIDSEIISGDPTLTEPAAKSKERVTLILPRPLVNLILARLAKAS